MRKVILVLFLLNSISLCYADFNTQCITNDNYTNCQTTDTQTGQQVQDTQCYGSDGYSNCNTTE